jgi:hypothetical protein
VTNERPRSSLRGAATLAIAGAAACSPTQVAWYGHTPDRAQVVEVRQKGDAQWLVRGGRASRRYRAVAADDLAFDADGRRLAFAAKLQDRPERWTVVTDFVEGPAWDAVAGLRFAPAGGPLVYAGLDHGRWSVVVDGNRGPGFEAVDVDSIAFSPGGLRVGYVADDGARGRACTRAMVGGLAGPCFAKIVGLAVADAPAGDVVVATDPAGGPGGGDAHVFVGGARVSDVRGARALSVDPGVRHWAVVVDAADASVTAPARPGADAAPPTARVVVDGSEPQEAFDSIGRVVWAADGSAVAYAARRGDRWRVVIGQHQSAGYAEVEEPVFAAGGARVGYLARDPGRSVVVIDGKTVWESDAPATALVLSADGSRRGWVYRDGTKGVIVVDDQRYPFDVVVEQTLRFSRDGRHWAALVGTLVGRKLYVTIDGRSSLPFDSEELFGDPAAGAQPRLGRWVSAELELYLSRGGRS